MLKKNAEKESLLYFLFLFSSPWKCTRCSLAISQVRTKVRSCNCVVKFCTHL